MSVVEQGRALTFHRVLYHISLSTPKDVSNWCVHLTSLLMHRNTSPTQRRTNNVFGGSANGIPKNKVG